MQAAIKEIQQLTHDLGLTINKTKTKIMHIRHRGPAQNLVKFIYHTHECLHNNVSNCNCEISIEMVEEHKYLGLIIDDRLHWGSHINNIRKKIRSGCGALQRLKYGIPFKTLKTVYSALIESVMSYGIQSWGRANQTDLDKIKKIQDRIIKLLLSEKYNNKFKTMEEKYKYTEILTVNSLYKYKLIKINYFTYLHTQTQENQTQSRNLRQNKRHIPLTYNKYGERLNDVAVPQIFNNLPIRVKQLTKIGEVKREIKKYFIEKQ